MDMLKVVQLKAPGGPEVLHLVEIPRPVPASGEVGVRAVAIGAGGPDVLICNGTYKWMPPMPAIPGNEMAGIVEAVGAGVTRLVKGQRVLVSARELKLRGGCYAQAICVAESAPFGLPDEIAFDSAVSLGNFQLSLALIESNGNLPAESIFIPGAAGGVASALTQVARAQGLRVIGTASTDEKRAFATANGVDTLLDPDVDTLAAKSCRSPRVEASIWRSIIWAEPCSLPACAAWRRVAWRELQHRERPPERRRLQRIAQAPRAKLGDPDDLHPCSRCGCNTAARPDGACHRTDGVWSESAPSCRHFNLSQAREVHELLDSGGTLGKLVLPP